MVVPAWQGVIYCEDSLKVNQRFSLCLVEFQPAYCCITDGGSKMAEKPKLSIN